MGSLSSIVAAPGALPLLGHLVPVLRDPLAFFLSLPEHGDLVRVCLGPFQAVVVCEPGLTHRVLLDDQTFDKGGPFIDRLREATGDGLGTCPFGEHRRQRRLVQPAFHPSRHLGYAQAMTAQIAEVTSSWRDGQILDVPAEMLTIAARIIGKTMFSDTLPGPVLQQVLDAFPTVVAGIYQRMFMPPPLDRLPTPGNRRNEQARTRLRLILEDIITKRRKSGTDCGDLLSALLAAHNPDSASGRQDLSDAEISAQLMTIYIAGAEAPATAMAWALYLVTRHPHIEARLHAEVDAVLHGGPAAYEHLPKLSLTRRVITEAMRLYPPGWLFTRSAIVDTHLGKHPIPAGTVIAYSPYLIHHRPDLYPDPERFDPDRWDDAQRSPPPRDAFIPFGGGARTCIGDQFAMIEGALALATIAARWRLRTLSDQPVRIAATAALYPRGLRMRAVARTHEHGATPRTDDATRVR
jgi:pentalenene oxygenase